MNGMTPAERRLYEALGQPQLPQTPRRQEILVAALSHGESAPASTSGGKGSVSARRRVRRWHALAAIAVMAGAAAGFAIPQLLVPGDDDALARELAAVVAEVPLPPGVGWPDLRFAVSEEGQPVLYELGNGYARANGFAQCAWYKELLEARSQRSAQREGQALTVLTEIERWPGYTRVFVDGTTWNTRYLDLFRSGDTSGVEEFLINNCRATTF